SSDLLFGGALAAHERLVRPLIPPLAVPTAPVNPDVLKIPVNGSHRRRAVEIEDDVGVRDMKGVGEDDLVGFAEDPAFFEIADDRGDGVVGRARARAILGREVALRLKASAP